MCTQDLSNEEYLKSELDRVEGLLHQARSELQSSRNHNLSLEARVKELQDVIRDGLSK